MADDIESALAGRICSAAKIDDGGLPDFKSCTVHEPDWFKVSKCQDEATHYWNQVLKYNKLYEGCHAPGSGWSGSGSRDWCHGAPCTARVSSANVATVVRLPYLLRKASSSSCLRQRPGSAS